MEPRELFLNRDLAWLEFNKRVLEEAQDRSLPLLDRLKFLCIFSSNLDEFFMVRVAGLRQQMAAGVRRVGVDGLTPAEVFERACQRVQELTYLHQYCLMHDVLPTLAREGVVIHSYRELDDERRRALARRFKQEIAPVLTPLALDPGHPFPHLLDRNLNLILELKAEARDEKKFFAVIQLPTVIPRLVHVGRNASKYEWVLLEELVTAHVGELFPGYHVVSCGPLRLTRNAELELEDALDHDLLETVETALENRPWSPAVRLEIPRDAAPEPIGLLSKDLNLEEAEIFRLDGILDVGTLMPLANLDIPRLKRPEARQRSVVRSKGESLFRWIRRGDKLLHHPYEPFDPVVELVQAAAEDPKVLAIKQTLYRTSSDSPFITALKTAARAGKQVTVLVELKARFDEQNNVRWARELEDAGVHVVYGILGLKTHCKVTLVVRKEGEGQIRRYAHLGTGNYHPKTARLYTDLSLLTADPAVTDECAELFNMLTGYSRFAGWERLVVSPRGMKNRLLELIAAEAALAKRGQPARIVAKMNALEDPDLIRALYDASSAGVAIDLIVRGLCCLRPGVSGLSENIRVRSIVGRFLEHSRCYYFRAGGREPVFIGSADWMPRNMDRRVEVLCEIRDPGLKERLLVEVLETALQDDVKARVQVDDGTYLHLTPAEGADPFEAHEQLCSDRPPARIRGAPLVRGVEVQAVPERRAGKRKRSMPLAAARANAN